MNILYIKNLVINKMKGRKIFLVLLDISILIFSYWISFSIQYKYYESNLIINKNFYFLIFINTIFAIIFYLFTNQYKALTRFTNSYILYKVGLRNLVVFSLFIVSNFLFGNNIPLFNVIFLWFISTSFMTYIRVIIKELIKTVISKKSRKISKIGIYGAGSAANLLASTIISDNSVEIIGFFDDNKELWGRSIFGKNIYAPNELEKFQTKLDYVILSIFSINKIKKQKIIKYIKSLNIPLFQFPSFEELQKIDLDNNPKNNIEFNELLGRNPNESYPELIKNSIFQKVCCITGAGGSIGGELVKQIIKFSPKKLILVELNEYALYSINQSVTNYSKDNIQIKSLLGNTANPNFIKNLFKKNKIDIVFHAAAYKHVPLVESNPTQGIYNNVISTQVICEESFKANIERFVFISTDKAVRPTNIMGASKRLGELIIQSYADLATKNKNKSTKFSIVRFGNVLGSSGSVIPLFKQQIENGGPITVTHQNVIRYFMTITEAVSLVLQASTLSKGGEVFVLDMGKPVKIVDLAKKLINLSGLTIKDYINPKGDISIEYVGLRKGEKLFEELLISGEFKKTIHPKIYKANEELIPFEILYPKILKLQELLLKNNEKEVFKLLKILVPEWNKQSSCIDENN